MLNELLATTPRLLGLSCDGRAQRWMVECPCCKKKFEPRTTRLARQEIDCPKCGKVLFADYNAEPPTVTVANACGEPGLTELGND